VQPGNEKASKTFKRFVSNNLTLSVSCRDLLDKKRQFFGNKWVRRAATEKLQQKKRHNLIKKRETFL
jgi:hypothetical protein